jgi:DNA repair protein RecO (recombination protein O)
VRSSLMIFYIEILNKTLKEHESNEPLFNCIYDILIELDKTQTLLSNHHIWFLLELAKHFGFYPSGTPGKYFNLREGTFDDEMPQHTFFIEESLSQKLYHILHPYLQPFAQIKLNSAERRILLYHLVAFYRLQLHDFGELKSLAVLEELFSEE